ncbi:ribulose-phosphate 3-epimerase [Collinsella sp. AGMB00827]|uniref:Ribulose-phosphate 3-epimerase n=1 Tax=Collinsella ureilytica TaxID=2869515 RepID=A0ABS7ML28_9ACTN|nr:ribulose-phosphate 3-epimerase [Collinsella urealyticum]MBY4798013.1 ribulose-phosphate 3-epimerase [Collinsella urealyticum]
MSSSVQIAPSILSADMAWLGRDLEYVSQADLIHFDVMDGHFTGNLTFGPDILRAVKRNTDLPLDVHMMVSDPDHMVEWFVEAGADMITVHWEASTHLHRTISFIHEHGVRAGVVLNPATPAHVLESIISDLDMVLVMSVNPGFGGQRFIPGALAKIKAVKRLAEQAGAAPLIEVDGGISANNIEEVVAAGADVIVAGSAIFGATDPAAEIERMRSLGNAVKAGHIQA